MRRVMPCVLSGIVLLAACTPTKPQPPGAPTTNSVNPTVASIVGSTNLPATGAPSTSVPPASTPSHGGPTILFQDDFSNESGGWDKQTSDNGSSGYGSGFYSIQVKAANYSIWANPGAQTDFSNASIEVDAAVANGAEDAGFGPICRYQDTGNFVHAIVTADGYYGIVVIKNQQYTVLTGNGKLIKNASIKTGKVTNHIQFECKDNGFTLFVNGQKLDAATDSSFSAGNIGLLASTFATAGVEVHFNNFLVTAP